MEEERMLLEDIHVIGLHHGQSVNKGLVAHPDSLTDNLERSNSRFRALAMTPRQ